MKKALAFLVALITLFTFSACSDSNGEDNGADGKKGLEKLAEKTPYEAYYAAIDYVKALTNYEIIIDGAYKSTYEGETVEEASTTLHRCSGDTFYYLYKAEDYEEFFLHDGNALYQSVSMVNEKCEISYSDFMNGWGSVTSEGMLITLAEDSFEKKLFIPAEDETYYLEFLITPEEYYEMTQGSVESPVEYRVYFNTEGNLVKFERKMVYYYYDVVLVEDFMKVNIQNVGSAPKAATPENAELFSVRVAAKDIDLSSVESLDVFEPSSEVTEYVLLDMKIEGSVKLSETETVENYEGKIVIRLYPEVAPLSVSNFQNLVGTAFYNGLKIHRVVKDFVIQGGDPKGDGTGGSDNEIFGEFSANGFTNNLSHKRGVVSMARSEENDSASSQIFICHADATTLDGNYAAFGYVVYGMDTVDIIAGLEVDENDAPKLNVTIEKASFLKKKA